MRIGTAKICLSNPEKTKSFVRCQHFFPSSHQRKVLGELIFLTEIRFAAEPNSKMVGLAEEIFEIIVNGLRTNYYVSESLKNDSVEENFENALQKLNRLIHQESISSKSFETLIKNLNAAVGLILEEKIYFSSVGSAQVFILKKNKIIDLVSEEVKSVPARVFSQIISGNLEKDDALFFSTANFLDYFVFEKLNTIVNKFPTEETSKKLMELLKNLNDKISVGALIMKKEKKDLPEQKNEIIEPEVIIKKEAPVKTMTDEKKQIKPVLPSTKPLKIKIETEKEDIQELRVIEEKTLPLKTEPRPTIPSSPKKEMPEKKLKVTLPRISFGFLQKIHWPKFKLPISQIKLLPLVIIILLVILLTTTFIRSQNQEKNTLRFFLGLQEIQAKNALLNASLTYGDTKKTNSLVEELKTMISTIKTSSSIEKELVDQLKNDFLTNTDKIYGVTRIKEPIIFADLKQLSSKQGFKKVISLSNDQIVILNQTTNEIYAYDQQKKITNLITKTNYKINKIIAADNDQVLIIGENQVEMLSLKSKKISSLKIETSRKNFKISDASLFDNKFYILDTEANQIFKYLKTDNGFNKEIPWLNEKVDLKNTSSLSIDGSVYLLNSSNQVQKFFMGKSQKITLDNPYPSLTKPTTIFTTTDLNHLYILEPSQKRILVYTKEGKLKKQIVSEKFIDLKDLTVNQKESAIFILDQDKIIEAGL